MKLSRLSILAVAALSCAAFAISCESDDASALAPFWADGDVDGGAGLNGGNGNGLNGGDGFGDLNGGDDLDADDVTVLVDYLLNGGSLPEGADADVDGNGAINIADVAKLIELILSSKEP